MPDARSPSSVRDEDLDDPLPAAPPTSPLLLWVSLGLALLVGSFAWIASTATRSTRAEERGDRIAAIVLQEARTLGHLDFDSTWQHELLFARIHCAAVARGLFVADLELRPARNSPSFGFLNKHYCIEVRPSPRAQPLDDESDLESAFEVLAWPRARTGPAKSVFFHPDDADAAYSRNLQSGFVDENPNSAPVPGRAHRRNDGRLGVFDYRGFDDERWLLEQRPSR